MKRNRFWLVMASLMGASITAASANFTGFYAGGTVGAAMLQGTHEYSNGTSSPAGKQKVNAIGYLAGGNLGYIKQMGDSKLVLGGEAYAAMAGPNAKKDLQIPNGPIEGKANISHKMILGAGIIIGAVMNPKVMMYTKLAYEMNKFELKYTNLTYGTVPSEKFTKSIRGIVPSLGALCKVSNSLLVGAEYSYALMGKLEPRKDTTVINGAQRGYSYTPTEHRVVAKIVYLF
ncbi:MAG: hypothetical protein EBT45_00555 [Alphaproteobacteria bacterium]|nr:hypothetical protein [Alphaproteobacteria bacterium]